MGETIALELRVLRQGSRSITLGVRCLGSHAPHTLRWSAQLVLVTTALVPGSSIAIPPDIVQAIARWQQLSGGNP
jgi:acyl-CoA thioesterase FadM